MRFSRVAAIVVCASSAMPSHADVPAPAQAPGLSATVDAYASFRLAESGRHLRGDALDIGELKISIADATATPIVAKDGTVVGLWLTGSGGWTYAAAAPSEKAVLETNRARVAPGLASTPGAISDRFTKAIVIFSEPLWAKEWDGSAGATGAAEAPPPGAASELDEAIRLVRATDPSIDFLLAQARMNGTGRWAYVEFAGGLPRVGYEYDEIWANREDLFGFRKLVDYHARFTETLAGHVLENRAGARTVSATLRHADFSIATADNKRGTIVSDLDLRVVGPKGARVLGLRLSNSLDPDSSDWDSKVNRLETHRVLDGEGHELPFAHRYHMLLVELPPLADGPAEVKLHVETEGEVFLDWKLHHGDNFFFLPGYWYPEPRNWRVERRPTFSIKTRTKKPWRPVTSGNETAYREGDDWIETESRSDKPTTFIAVLGAKYVTHEETIDGRKIRVHGYSMARKNVLENLPKLAGAIIRFYTGLLGPMAADELDIVEAPEFGLGVSTSGVVILPTEAFKPHDEEANPYVRGINMVLAHEIAHQWFGNGAVPASDEDDWLAESLAEYWGALATGTLLGDKKGVEGFPQFLAEWRGEAPNCESTGPISGVAATGGEQHERDAFCLLYNRGPLVVHMLRTLIGNDRFAAAAKSFLDRAAGSPASTDDFSRAASDTVHADLGWLFDDWIRKGGTPDLKVETKLTAASGGKRLTGTVSETGNGGFKRVMVPLVLDVGGHAEVRLVFVDKPQTTFEFDVPGETTAVRVDPGHNNLVRYR